ncbi:MAG: ATP-binding protein [Candidatus Marinimicrobia bacterium]|nr:ATP-binding protein [Candidatus Neomarinimicrobiota bacterium]
MADRDADVFAMAVGEACKNAVLYSTANNKVFELILNINNKRIVAEVTNKGEPIDFDNIEPFDKRQDFMQYRDGGLGIPIIKKVIDKVEYERINGLNKLSLIKHISMGDK